MTSRDNAEVPVNRGGTPGSVSPLWGPVLLHLKIGWWMLLAFVTLGIALESMHGFKIDFYLSVDRAATRTLWTLAHSVGAILGLVHIAFAASLLTFDAGKKSSVSLISACLNCASMLVPGAFLAAGIAMSEQSVPLGFLLAIPGLFFLLLALLLTARATSNC